MSHNPDPSGEIVDAFQGIRHRIFVYCALVGAIAPVIIGPILSNILANQPMGLIVASWICSVGSAVNLLAYRWHSRIGPATMMQTLVMDAAFLIAIYCTGGLASPYLAYAPLMVIASAFPGGKYGTIASLIFISIGLTFTCIYGGSDSAPGRDGWPLALLQILLALGASGAFALVYDYIHLAARSREMAQFQARQESEARLREANERLADSEDLLHAVIEHMPTMVFVKDYTKGGAYRYMNPAALKALGRTLSDVIGKTTFDIMPKELAKSHFDLDREAFAYGGTIHIAQEEIVTADGGTRQAQTWKVPLYDRHGNPRLIIGIALDMTDALRLKHQVEIERAKAIQNAKLASLGELSAGIAHEINNPITIIYGTARALPKYVGDAQALESRLKLIMDAALRVSKIVQGLRKFSRSSEQSPRSRHTLKAIISEALVLTQNRAQRENTTVKFEAACDGPVLVNEIEIEQVFINLINNGIDACRGNDSGWVHVTLFESKGKFVVHVRDGGKGIEASVRPKLFQPFFTTKSVGEGTGLGLSISKGILEVHGATIDLLDGEATTCFEVTFPYDKEIKDADHRASMDLHTHRS